MNKITRFAVVCALAVFGAGAAAAARPEALVQTEGAFAASLNDILSQAKRRDAFAEVPQCAIIDALPFRAYTLPEAVALLEPCLKALSSRYGVEITAASSEAAGLRITVKGQLPFGSAVLADLDRAINSRQGQLMGLPVALGTRSALQDTLDRCILALVVREIGSSEDFIRVYGGCIKRDPALQVRSVQAVSNRDFAVALESAVARPVLESLNGEVVVNAGSGPVKVLVLAYPSL